MTIDKILMPCREVEIDGKQYKINPDFDLWIEIGELFLCGRDEQNSSMAKILALAYPVLPDNPIGAFEKILWFFSCGKEKEKNVGSAFVKAPAVSLKRDFGYIWAAFIAEFGIDLSTAKLHWWRFCALLAALGDDCRFSKIVSYRTMDVAAVKDRKLRQFYETMKAKYRLPDIRSEEERELETVCNLESLF